MKSCHSKTDGDGSDGDRLGDELDVETEAAPDRRVGRRTFVKGIGATAAAGVGTKYVGSPVGEAEAVVPFLVAGAIGVAAGAVGGLAFGATFAGPADSEVAASLDWQAHVDEFTRAREDQLMLDQTLASLKRDVSLVENKAREQAIFAIFEQGVDSGTSADATAAAESAINDAYATVEKSILNSWEIRIQRMLSSLNLLGVSRIDGSADVEYAYQGTPTTEGGGTGVYDGGSGPINTQGSHTLLDGTSIQYTGHTEDNATASNDVTITFDPLADYPTRDSATSIHWDSVVIYKPDPADYSTVDEPLAIDDNAAAYFKTKPWADALSTLYDRHTAVMGEVSSMVDSYYQPAKDGEIDLYEAVGPAYLTDTAQTAQDYEEAALALRAMGFPLSDQVVTIEVPTEDGSGLQLTGRLSWTAHMGNALSVGGTLNAPNIPGSIYAAVNLPEGVDSVTVTNTTNTTTNTTDTSGETGPGAEIIEITDTFEIVSAEGASEVTFEDRTLAEATSTNEEINQVFKENYEANEKATSQVYDTATGGGGGAAGGLLGGLSNRELGIAALGAAALAVLFGR